MHLALEDRDRCGWDDDGRGRRLVLMVTPWSAHFSILFYFFLSCVLCFLFFFSCLAVFFVFSVLLSCEVSALLFVQFEESGFFFLPVRVVQWPLWITAV